MVLYKRKPVQLLPPADIEDENAEVWHIPQTGEIFPTYEEYLARMDFYKQRRFNDQITGHSGLTFFEAFESELSGGREVEELFPEALKGPILRKVQFQIVSRLDHLVDTIYDEFKRDYYPGEEVAVTLEGGDRVHGLVRDKTTFGPRVLPDGSRTLPVTRYLVNIHGKDDETIVTDEHICRDRGAFTKSMLRSFIKKTVIREAWTGAPWLVKHDYANQYHIDTRVPPHLRYDTKLLERKQLQAQKRLSGHDINGHGPELLSGPVRLPDLKPATKGQRGKHGAKIVNGINGVGKHKEPTPPPPPPKYPIEDLALPPREGSVRPKLKFMCRNAPAKQEANSDGSQTPYDNIDMATVGSLLETWDTLNVYCEIFQLDSFTFDDFVEAMSVASERVEVQLFDEVHCSVLKILVDAEGDGGRVRINLPDMEGELSEDEEEDEDDEDEEEEEEEGKEDRGGDEDEQQEENDTSLEVAPKRSGRATRSSLAKIEAERLAAEAAAAEAEAAAAEEQSFRFEQETKTKAEELMRQFDWIEQLRKRDFLNGGWQRIAVGLLHQLSKGSRHKKHCEKLLEKLVPEGTEPTVEAVQQTYSELDINMRVEALQIMCMLTMETKAVRGYMDDCSETMTKYRKDRIEWTRQKKQAIEELRPLHEQRKELVPDDEPDEPLEGDESVIVKTEEDVKMPDVEDPLNEKADSIDADATEDEDAGETKGRSGARVAAVKKRKAEEEKKKKLAAMEREREKERERERVREKEREREAEKAKKNKVKLTPQQQKQYNKILKEIQKKEEIIKECEEEVGVIENDLREADCPRTRVLGKDRFWNRYYWFERNGMPYGGLPTSSTATAEYANGCIWVQGPDDMEREGYIDGPADLQNDYKARFSLTVAERKTKEEDGTSLYTARQWGYISDPEDLNSLIRWLDPRGFNELKLRKELLLYKERIAKHMDNRKRYLDSAAEEEERNEPVKRTSSRIREKTPEPPSYRCLQWENTMALEELGHLHSDPPPPPRIRKQSRKRAAAEPEKETRRTRRRG